jgi:hypothetical protein
MPLCLSSGSWGLFCGVELCDEGLVFGGVVGRVGVPAGPDDSKPGAGHDTDGVGVAFAAAAGVGVELGRPG